MNRKLIWLLVLFFFGMNFVVLAQSKSEKEDETTTSQVTNAPASENESVAKKEENSKPDSKNDSKPVSEAGPKSEKNSSVSAAQANETEAVNSTSSSSSTLANNEKSVSEEKFPKGEKKDGSEKVTPANSSGKSTASGPVMVEVNIFVQSIGKLDFNAGKYVAEFELQMTGPDENTPFSTDFELYGGRIIKKEEQKSDDPATKIFRVEIENDLDSDFKRFPWDSQDLSIQFYNPSKSVKKQIYEVMEIATGEKRIDEKVKLAGWIIKEDEPYVEEDSSLDSRKKYSVITFPITIKRLRFAATMKVFFPLIIMTLISFLALSIGAGAAVNRLTILTGTLLAAVMFHLNAASSIPQIGYLTLLDKVFFGSYISFLLNLILTIVIMKYNEKKLEDKVKTYYGLAIWLVPVATGVLWMLAFTGII
ncbi:MAG: hypothetical protein HQM08_20620 [Candidatus Riflebacteria bacterium]|nr:hypothetical protein [Candidatus Riflebacteria bacterium]